MGSREVELYLSPIPRKLAGELKAKLGWEFPVVEDQSDDGTVLDLSEEMENLTSLKDFVIDESQINFSDE